MNGLEQGGRRAVNALIGFLLSRIVRSRALADILAKEVSHLSPIVRANHLLIATTLYVYQNMDGLAAPNYMTAAAGPSHYPSLKLCKICGYPPSSCLVLLHILQRELLLHLINTAYT